MGFTSAYSERFSFFTSSAGVDIGGDGIPDSTPGVVVTMIKYAIQKVEGNSGDTDIGKWWRDDSLVFSNTTRMWYDLSSMATSYAVSTGTLTRFGSDKQVNGCQYALHFKALASDGGQMQDSDVIVTTFTVDVSSPCITQIASPPAAPNNRLKAIPDVVINVSDRRTASGLTDDDLARGVGINRILCKYYEYSVNGTTRMWNGSDWLTVTDESLSIFSSTYNYFDSPYSCLLSSRMRLTIFRARIIIKREQIQDSDSAAGRFRPSGSFFRNSLSYSGNRQRF